MKNRPVYAIESVDNALLLTQLLVLEGPLRVTEAAARLGVSPSTAHRLLGMLVYRDFAEQGPDKRYRAGSALGGAVGSEAPVAVLRRVGRPHLEQLVRATQESANLMVLSGAEVRFVETVECTQILRVGDRAGKALPAHRASAGKAMMAVLDADTRDPLIAALDVEEQASLRRELPQIRRNGFAINNQRTETGLTALGMAVTTADARVVAGISLALPTVRFRKDRVPGWVREMRTCVTGIAADLDRATAGTLAEGEEAL
ncbi:MAG TPA: IclR family transcriptional regulator [Microlunatus sp.]|nr:IclR family transcriptional regulator [Microlunatus sp.]